ncbi:hypothetical protein DL768_007574 [Monosporascus sp. mg162]|nr:hypothetical protein DL768_007574 [Monosporascus sp. mg162]
MPHPITKSELKLTYRCSLADCAIRTKSFLDAVSGSSAEFLRLEQLLDHSYVIAANVRAVLERGKNAHSGERQVSDCVHASLATCMNVASCIEGILAKAMKTRRGTSALDRVRAQIRLACKRGEIEGLENRFYGAVAVLSLTMNLHVAMRAAVTVKPIHILEQQTEDMLRQIFFDKDLTSFRGMFDSGAVTLSSVTTDGLPLLLLAQMCWDDAAVAWLVQQRCPVDSGNVELW